MSRVEDKVCRILQERLEAGLIKYGQPQKDSGGFFDLLAKACQRVCFLFQSRADMGMTKYGVSVERTDLSTKEWLKHARDEAMDLAVYLTRLIGDYDDI